MKLIITGGRQADSKLSYFNKEWNNGIEGVIFEYDPKKNLIKEKISYKTPLENRPIDNSVYHSKVVQYIIINFT